jgi:hypothetical protein
MRVSELLLCPFNHLLQVKPMLLLYAFELLFTGFVVELQELYVLGEGAVPELLLLF